MQRFMQFSSEVKETSRGNGDKSFFCCCVQEWDQRLCWSPWSTWNGAVLLCSFRFTALTPRLHSDRRLCGFTLQRFMGHVQMFTWAWHIAVCTPHMSLLWVIVTVCNTSLCHWSWAVGLARMHACVLVCVQHRGWDDSFSHERGIGAAVDPAGQAVVVNSWS